MTKISELAAGTRPVATEPIPGVQAGVTVRFTADQIRMPSVGGSRGSPVAITAAGGVSPLGFAKEIKFIQGSPGAVVVTANPQVAAGTAVGQELVLQGSHAVSTVTLSNGTGLELNGPCVLGLASILSLVWNGTTWSEVSRNGY